MKSRKPLSNLICSLSVIMMLFALSCTKENSGNGTNEQEEQVSRVSSESEAEAEMIFNGVFDDVMGVNDEVGMAGTGIFGRSALGTTGGTNETSRPNACFTVTVTHPNQTPFPVRVVIDFGPVACMGPDGHTRRGKIISEYTNRLIMPGAVATTTFHDFYFDSIKVEGTHKITNTSAPIGTLPPSRQFTVQVIDGKLTNYNTNFIEWNSTKTITQIEGILTHDFPRDDIFRIEGHSRGRAKRGTLLVAWESGVVEPLIKKFLCRWIVKGTIRTVRLNATTNNQWVAVLNFGNGACDNQAVITINGVSHQITLR
jgi:hypothetical protein